MNLPGNVPVIPGETPQRRGAARRVQGRRAVAGTLYLTSLRLVFVPHPIARGLGGEAVQIALRDVEAVGRVPMPRGELLVAGPGDRLALVLTGGHVEHYRLPRLSAMITAIRAAREAATG
ncbi:hypothetical protein LX16_4428 [Stackebrandtia albiflava]|uniref:GRAM domain-containing protein n=1 Tax=Stackebrandtia albiflava TaxID=406432 RepID=A0A562URH3_9ACTN|nr:hypothetical protein [Stackebrandtia albiflava]TWJ08207.1 hypothetical protein LX16_4428 [Stackebrandtia albiflava]